MEYFMYILLGFLVVCAIAVSVSKNLLNSILIFMSYSLVMSIIWICLESPDLAITEAAVGAGVTTVLFLVTLKKLHTMKEQEETGIGEADAQAEAPKELAAKEQKTDNLAAGTEGEDHE